jgi:hypothetical protein
LPRELLVDPVLVMFVRRAMRMHHLVVARKESIAAEEPGVVVNSKVKALLPIKFVSN